MKSAFTMWKNKRMVILAAVCAVIYGGARAVLTIDFPILDPDVMGIRVASMFPMIFGLLFGPAGAWGAALGNLIGDLGALTWKSLFDFIGIFLLGYLPYTMWTTLKPLANGQREPAGRNWRSWVLYILIALISAAASSVVITTWLEALGYVPYTVLFAILLVVSVISVCGSLIGGIVLLVVYGVVKKRLGLIWWDVMDEQDIGEPLAGTLGAWLVTGGTLVGTAGTLVGFGGISAGQAIGIVGMVLIVVGSILV